MHMITMPLSGIRVMVTRSSDQARILSAKLQNLGATTIEIPMIEVTTPSDTGPIDRSIRDLTKYDWIIFTSVHGVEFFLQRMAVLHVPFSNLGSVKIATIGPATSIALQNIGRSPDYVPSEFLSENIAPGLGRLEGKRILLPRADIASQKLPIQLREMGACVDEVVAYWTITPRELNSNRLRAGLESGVNVITFTSPSTVRNFAKALERAGGSKYLNSVKVACIGPVTAEAARRVGMTVGIIAQPHTIDALVEAIASEQRS